MEGLLEQDPKSLQRQMEKTLESSFGKKADPYLLWVNRRQQLPTANQLIDEYHVMLRELFGELKDAWF